MRPAHAGNALYFVLMVNAMARILKYDLGTREITGIQPPPMSGRVVLTTAEGGGLGCVTLEGSRLQLWSSEVGPHGDMEWAESRVIEIRTLVPAGAFLLAFDVVSFADGGGVIYVGTHDASYVTDLKSGHVRKVERVNGWNKIIPYISFFTPALGEAYTGEDPRAGA